MILHIFSAFNIFERCINIFKMNSNLNNFRMSRFLSLKKKKPAEKYELNKGEDNNKDNNYGSITSLINNEVGQYIEIQYYKCSMKLEYKYFI